LALLAYQLAYFTNLRTYILLYLLYYTHADVADTSNVSLLRCWVANRAALGFLIINYPIPSAADGAAAGGSSAASAASAASSPGVPTARNTWPAFLA